MDWANIIIVRASGRKNVTIQIMPDARIKISVPHVISKSKILEILTQKKSWIEKHQQKIKVLNLNNNENLNQTALYLGKRYEITKSNSSSAIVEFRDKFYIASNNTDYYRSYLTGWYKRQALAIISPRAQFYSKNSGLNFSSISINSASTHWGSCSHDKNLHFSWNLIMAPLPIIDYVIAHELSHIAHMNHSQQFWLSVAKISPLYRQQRTWLKRNGGSLKF